MHQYLLAQLPSSFKTLSLSLSGVSSSAVSYVPQYQHSRSTASTVETCTHTHTPLAATQIQMEKLVFLSCATQISLCIACLPRPTCRAPHAGQIPMSRLLLSCKLCGFPSVDARLFGLSPSVCLSVSLYLSRL